MRIDKIAFLLIVFFCEFSLQAAPSNYDGMPTHQFAYDSGYELGSSYACKDTNIYKNSYSSTLDKSAPFRGQLNIYNQAYSKGYTTGLHEPIDCQTGKLISIPAILNNTDNSINKVSLVSAIKDFYDKKGVCSGKFIIEKLVRIKIEENGPAFNAHVYDCKVLM